MACGLGGKKPKTFNYEGPREASAVLEFVLTHIGKLARARLAGKPQTLNHKPQTLDPNGQP